MRRYAFVDEVQAAREFGTGDIVRKTGIRDFVLTPYVGRVVYSNPRTGKVQVQWPWGSEQESPTELVKDVSGHFVPPMAMDQTLSTWESARYTGGEILEDEQDAAWRRVLASRVSGTSSGSRIVAAYERNTLPVWRAACKALHEGNEEFVAFRSVLSSCADDFGPEVVRITVGNLYELGRRYALYWKDNKRRYKVTQREKETGSVCCPRCKGTMKPRIYRQGQRVLMCRTCGFSIHPRDLVK
jgi:ribosomal protein L37AE/L43A